MPDVLFDGNTSTCINTNTELSVFRREVTLDVPEPQSSVVSVSVVGELMACDEDNNGLQFYVNAAPVTSTETCQHMEMNRCRFVLADN